LASCVDRPGIIAGVAQFVHDNGGNIIDFDQHSDTTDNVFFLRAEWTLDGFAIGPRSPQRSALWTRRVRGRCGFVEQRCRLRRRAGAPAGFHDVESIHGQQSAGRGRQSEYDVAGKHDRRPSCSRHGIRFQTSQATLRREPETR
jgi:formyltetrahydrofolate deformylase